MSHSRMKARTPHFPTYAAVRRLLEALPGESAEEMRHLVQSIHAQVGTPQNPVDWTDPNAWIPTRLQDPDARLARHIWEASSHTENPRYVHHPLRFIQNYGLLAPDAAGRYCLTEKGAEFKRDGSPTVREIDDAEGILELLSILSTKPQAQVRDLLPEWSTFLTRYSNLTTPITHQNSLRERLANLIDRGLVLRDGNAYTLSPQGLDYLMTNSAPNGFTLRTAGGAEDPAHHATDSGSRAHATAVAPAASPPPDPHRRLYEAIHEANAETRSGLRGRLSRMHPYRFEHLVRDLLAAMGYSDVQVTKASGDRGIDVVARVEFGITTITEVIQVKRHQGTIGRPILDQLRGALPLHNAIRGTLITLSDFSSDCKRAAVHPGAAPIGLINGEKLLDLLFQHSIAVKQNSVPLYVVDEVYFEAGDAAEDSVPEADLGSEDTVE